MDAASASVYVTCRDVFQPQNDVGVMEFQPRGVKVQQSNESESQRAETSGTFEWSGVCARAQVSMPHGLFRCGCGVRHWMVALVVRAGRNLLTWT